MPRESHISDGAKALLRVGNSGQRVQGPGNNSFYGRVINIVLSQDDTLFKKYKVLEAIEFEPVHDRSIVAESGDKERSYLVAYKFHSSVRTPVINEIVPLFNAPNLLVQSIDSQFSEVFYYSDPVALYTAIEHNAAPDQNTLQNINNINSSQNKASSYQNSNTGVGTNSPGSDTILSKDSIKFGDYFLERGIKPLSPLEGDHKLEGRFGNSIRFGGTPSSKVSSNLSWQGTNVGSPAIIIRNNQRKIDPKINTDSLFEDINKDGSSLYILSDQVIELELASNNFDSYKQQNDNSQVKSQVIISSPTKQTVSQSANTSDTIAPLVDIQVSPVSQNSLHGSNTTPTSDLDAVPDNEDDLNFVQIGQDILVPLTQGVILNSFNTSYKFIEGTNASSGNISFRKAPTISLSSVNAIKSFAGQVSNVPTITNNGKALLDLLALTEGTIGQGSFNGYDLMVGGGLIPGYNSAISNPIHPNIKVYITDYKIYSTAAGRYQFVINTWNLVAGKDVMMSKFNQDYACWKNILNSANVPSLLITKSDTDFNSFKQVINMMASQWASLPVINDPKGLYKQAGRFSFETLYTYFKQILAKYS